MKILTKITLFAVIILILVQTSVLAQNPKSQIPNLNSKLDSLKLLLKTAKHDTIKLRILDAIIEAEPDEKIWSVYNNEMKTIAEKLIANKPFKSNSPQSKCLKPILKTAKKCLSSALNNIGFICMNQSDIPKAIEYYNKSLKICEDIGDKQGMANSFNNIGMIYDNLGDIPKALEYYNKSIKIQEDIGDKDGMSYSFNNIGMIYKNQGDIPKAIEYYNKSLKIREDIGDKHGMATSFNNIGFIYNHQGDIPKAIEFYNKSLKICEDIGDKQGIACSFNNVGMIYKNQGDIPKALEYYNKSLIICEGIGYKQGMATSFNNIGFIYNNHGDIPKAIEYYKKSLKIQEAIGDKDGMSYSFNNIGDIYLKKNDINNAKSYAEKAYKLSKELGFPDNIEGAAGLQKKVCEKLGDYQKALEYYEEEILMRDSINNKENFKKTQKQHAKYEYEKRAATDSIIHGKAMEIKNIEVKKQKTVIGFTAFGLLLILVIAVIIFRSLRITRKQKKIIEKQKHLVDEKNNTLNQQNEEIRTQRDEIEAQRDEITAQRDLVTQQKEHIEEIHKEVTDSINYAKRIQQAVLPDLKFGAWNLEFDSFILFKPKDVVSGDFYWATKVNEFLIITVADCTGHGVPGAFMSMLGISFLNEIVRKKEVTQAAHVLDQLRESVIDALKQKGESGEQKDGMDIALCVINTTTYEMQFAGANNPLWIVPMQQEAVSNPADYHLLELKPDKMPVAIYENMKPFSNHIINLCKGDMIYLASDGFEDQFGGPKNKKFLSKNMKELLKSNSHKLMTEQKSILEKAINDWKGETEQIDDITVMGIKI